MPAVIIDSSSALIIGDLEVCNYIASRLFGWPLEPRNEVKDIFNAYNFDYENYIPECSIY